MIDVLAFALYGPLAASTRYRLGQYVSGLASLGIAMEIRHLLGDEYLRSRFHGERMPWGSLVRDGCLRLRDLRELRNYDVAMIHCELFPFMPGWLEHLLLDAPYIYDMDDAFYLRYKTGRLRAAKAVLGEKFDGVMARASEITAGSSVLSHYAEKHNSRVTYLPTVLDTDRYVPLSGERRQAFTVGWIGSPTTATYLRSIIEPLSALGREGPVNLVVVGGKAPRIPDVNVIQAEWTEQTEIAHLNSFDVGVMPLNDDEWARGKCAFKLIQYMACGVPVVASRVGANLDVVTPECGFLASTPEEWLAALRELRNEMTLRERMGEAARARVVDHYSLRITLPKLASVISRAAVS
jgi:glycosyltransferase involved in cell wall biosynthesis